MDYVYQVDPLQTNDIIKVPKSKLHDDTPIGMWLMVMLGDGGIAILKH